MNGRSPYAAVILAGGAGRRMGGADKPALAVAGRPMLHRVLLAAVDARPRVVVGPPRHGLPSDVVRVREEPPGGGPVAAAAAGLRVLPSTGIVALLAADLPYLTGEALAHLTDALRSPELDGVVPVDDSGRRQLLCGVWRIEALLVRLDALGPPAGQPFRRLVEGLRIAELHVPGAADGASPPPWYDCDTEEDLRRAEEWPAHEGA